MTATEGVPITIEQTTPKAVYFRHHPCPEVHRVTTDHLARALDSVKVSPTGTVRIDHVSLDESHLQPMWNAALDRAAQQRFGTADWSEEL